MSIQQFEAGLHDLPDSALSDAVTALRVLLDLEPFVESDLVDELGECLESCYCEVYGRFASHVSGSRDFALPIKSA